MGNGTFDKIEIGDEIKLVDEPVKKKSDTDFSWVKEFLYKSKDEYGTTNNPDECGYILIDGSMLDFSNKKHGGRAGIRNADHREITNIGTDMFDFCNFGNIRYQPESQWFMICKLPTESQFRTMARICKLNDGEISIECMNNSYDWGNSNKTFSKEYMIHTPFARVRKDIEGYFKETK